MPIGFPHKLTSPIPIKEVRKLALSFSGCGFLGAYHFGVAKCLHDHGKNVVGRVDRVAGASAGSLAASLLILSPEKIDQGAEMLYKFADAVNTLRFGALTPGFHLNDELAKVIDSFLPLDVSPAQDRLFISVTDLKTYRNELVSSFASRHELIDYLLASCYIPYYSMGYSASAPIIKGKSFIDGGYTNNLPSFRDMRTITCSPFSGDADICPRDARLLFSDWMFSFGNQNFRVNSANALRGARALFPPSRLALQQYFNMGFTDAQRFLQGEKVYNV